MNSISTHIPPIQKPAIKNPPLRFAGGADDADGIDPKQFARAKDTWRKAIESNKTQDPTLPHPNNVAISKDRFTAKTLTQMGVDLNSSDDYKLQLDLMTASGELDRSVYKSALDTHQNLEKNKAEDPLAPIILSRIDQRLIKYFKRSANETPDYLLFHRYNNAIKSLSAYAEKASSNIDNPNPLSLLQLQFSNNEKAQDEVVIDSQILNILLQEKITEHPEEVPDLNQKELQLLSNINRGSLQILTQINGQHSQQAYKHYFSALSQLIPASSESEDKNPFEAVIDKNTINERIDALLDSLQNYYPQLSESFGFNLISVGDKQYPMLSPQINTFSS